ncbi:MAG: helix-turn-helix transcriptional regulator [Alistipes sp.]|nr:helix-turn-helix transcriptional regulator [Alistipes sp.]
MERQDILREPEYWIAQIQMAMYKCALDFMNNSGKNRSQLAEHLGVSKGYVTQLLSGDYNYSLTKLVQTAMTMGYVPKVTFIPLEQEICRDENVGTFVLATKQSIGKFETFGSKNYDLVA